MYAFTGISTVNDQSDKSNTVAEEEYLIKNIFSVKSNIAVDHSEDLAE